MRELKYAVEGKAANLKTFAMDEPGHGGACHHYLIESSEFVDSDGEDVLPAVHADIVFHNGPINEDGNGVNGVQHEDLLAIIINRLEGFETGPYACAENAAALQACRYALQLLNARTRERIKRRVEGTHKV